MKQLILYDKLGWENTKGFIISQNTTFFITFAAIW